MMHIIIEAIMCIIYKYASYVFLLFYLIVLKCAVHIKLAPALPVAHHQACSDGQNQQPFVVDLSMPCHERYLEWRQAEYAQLHVRATTVEKLEEGIKKRVLVVCYFNQAYFCV